MARILVPLVEREQPGAEDSPQHQHSSKVYEKVVYRGKIYICRDFSDNIVSTEASGAKITT